MNEQAFKTMTGTGIMDLVVGILVLGGGIVMGVLLVVSGARLLRSRSKVMI